MRVCLVPLLPVISGIKKKHVWMGRLVIRMPDASRGHAALSKCAVGGDAALCLGPGLAGLTALVHKWLCSC